MVVAKELGSVRSTGVMNGGSRLATQYQIQVETLRPFTARGGGVFPMAVHPEVLR